MHSSVKVLKHFSLRSGLWLGRCNNLIHFFFQFLLLDRWSSIKYLEYFVVLRSSWLNLWVQGAQVLCLQNKPKPLPLHHCAYGLCWNAVVVFTYMKHLYSHVSKWYCCSSPGNCSDLTGKPCCHVLCRELRLSHCNPSKTSCTYSIFFQLFCHEL